MESMTNLGSEHKMLRLMFTYKFMYMREKLIMECLSLIFKTLLLILFNMNHGSFICIYLRSLHSEKWSSWPTSRTPDFWIAIPPLPMMLICVISVWRVKSKIPGCAAGDSCAVQIGQRWVDIQARIWPSPNLPLGGTCRLSEKEPSSNIEGHVRIRTLPLQAVWT